MKTTGATDTNKTRTRGRSKARLTGHAYKEINLLFCQFFLSLFGNSDLCLKFDVCFFIITFYGGNCFIFSSCIIGPVPSSAGFRRASISEFCRIQAGGRVRPDSGGRSSSCGLRHIPIACKPLISCWSCVHKGINSFCLTRHEFLE